MAFDWDIPMNRANCPIVGLPRAYIISSEKHILHLKGGEEYVGLDYQNDGYFWENLMVMSKFCNLLGKVVYELH